MGAGAEVLYWRLTDRVSNSSRFTTACWPAGGCGVDVPRSTPSRPGRRSAEQLSERWSDGLLSTAAGRSTGAAGRPMSIAELSSFYSNCTL